MRFLLAFLLVVACSGQIRNNLIEAIPSKAGANGQVCLRASNGNKVCFELATSPAATTSFKWPRADSIGCLQTTDTSGTLVINPCGGGGGNVSTTLPTTTGNIPAWSSTAGALTSVGIPYTDGATADTLASRDAYGNSSFRWVGTYASFSQTSAIDARRFDNITPTSYYLMRFLADFGAGGGVLSGIRGDGSFSGTSDTTLAFTTNPANCSAGQAAAGITAAGVAEGCFTPSGGNGIVTWNVKTDGGAVGNGVTDDTTAIQNVINTCQDSAYGGIIFFPPGIYATSATLTIGNGTSTSESTKKRCSLIGAGGQGLDGTRLGASTIRWTGSAPGATTYMLTYRGPMQAPGRLSDLTLDCNDKANLRGLLLMGVSHLRSDNLGIVRYKLGMVITADHTGVTTGYGACENKFYGLKIQAYASGGSALELNGNDVSGGADACSNAFFGAMLWHDGATANTFGVKLGFADNNRFYDVNIYSFGGSNGCGIYHEAQAVNTIFPHENVFYNVSPHHGVCGTAGAGYPTLFWAFNQGDCAYNCDPENFVSAGVKPVVLSIWSVHGMRRYNTYSPASYGTQEHDWVADANMNLHLSVYSGSAATDRAGLHFRRWRGTKASPSSINTGDRLGTIAFWGFVTSAPSVGAVIESYTTNVSGGAFSGDLRFRTSALGVLSDRWKIPETGHFLPAADATYDVGASGATVRDYWSRTRQGATKTITISGTGCSIDVAGGIIWQSTGC